MADCWLCGKEGAAKALSLCPDCLKAHWRAEIVSRGHASRQKYGLPPSPPRHDGGFSCRFCANECRLTDGKLGFCGLRINRNRRIHSVTPPKTFVAHIYYDPLPTNCCAAWFCKGAKERGVNLAVFLYGCNYDCLFCQNASHRLINSSHFLSLDDLVQAALAPQVRCVCFFGGSPEPQLPLALEASREIRRLAPRTIHICWEWNGAGHPSLVRQAAAISSETGGTVKFDLKAWTPQIGEALCGVPVQKAYENLAMLGELFPSADLLTATTLLVPYYVDEKEVEPIARFLSRINPNFPYSLLIFHPDDRMKDLPITPRRQVKACFAAAKRYLNRVNIGNLHLLDRAE